MSASRASHRPPLWSLSGPSLWSLSGPSLWSLSLVHCAEHWRIADWVVLRWRRLRLAWCDPHSAYRNAAVVEKTAGRREAMTAGGRASPLLSEFYTGPLALLMCRTPFINPSRTTAKLCRHSKRRSGRSQATRKGVSRCSAFHLTGWQQMGSDATRLLSSSDQAGPATGRPAGAAAGPAPAPR
jgi:hypothetical protein